MTDSITPSTANVIIRPVKREDRGHVFSSWLHNQYWSSGYYFQYMPQDLFFKEYTNHINTLLSRPSAQIDVAVLDTDPDSILGYIVYEPETLHWVYVKRHYRGKSIGKLLLGDKEFSYYTGATPPGHDIAKHLKLQFNPFK